MASQNRPEVSIICPMFNEAAEIESNIARLKACLNDLPYLAEVLLINDGSSDDTVERPAAAVAGDPRFRLLSHRVNFGRGRALRTGFREARCEIIVTTEGDLSWGTDIIQRMVAALINDPGLDAVFASTHLPGGGYRNVPWHRLWLSKLGNRILRLLYSGDLSMTTGMTRAYRARVIQAHNFSQDGKEIHLEVAHRLLSFGRRVAEVPAVLSWPDKKPGAAGRGKRTNWSKIFRLISTHLAFGLLNGLSNVIGPIILAMSAMICFFGGWAVWNAIEGLPSIYLANLTGVLVILWVNLCLGYFLIYHAYHIETNVWKTQSMVRHLLNVQQMPPDPDDYYDEVNLGPAAAGASSPARETLRSAA